MFSLKGPTRVPAADTTVEILVKRVCSACGITSEDTVPAIPTAPYIPGTGNGEDIPPFVCRDFRTCCLRYRRGLSPTNFGIQLNWKAYV